MKTCPICKKENDDTAKFCTECDCSFDNNIDEETIANDMLDKYNGNYKIPIHKKWWFKALIIVFIFAFLGYLVCDETTPTETISSLNVIDL